MTKNQKKIVQTKKNQNNSEENKNTEQKSSQNRRNFKFEGDKKHK